MNLVAEAERVNDLPQQGCCRTPQPSVLQISL
jgi:hypothetical protein